MKGILVRLVIVCALAGAAIYSLPEGWRMTELAIASRDVVANGEVLRVTASLGVAQGRRGEPYSEALKRADEALYRAKRSGRNRVECEADAAAER